MPGPLAARVGGKLILIMPRLPNDIAALCLILVGLLGLPPTMMGWPMMR